VFSWTARTGGAQKGKWQRQPRAAMSDNGAAMTASEISEGLARARRPSIRLHKGETPPVGSPTICGGRKLRSGRIAWGASGPSQVWGSGGYRRLRVCIVGRVEFLSVA
jgi:hypothetical protein